MYNKAMLIGNLTRDPELRYTPNSKAVCNFTIAVNEKRGNEETTLFVDCTAWEKTAELTAQYTAKGRQVFVEGRIQERQWEKDGTQHKKWEIVVTQIQFLGKRGE